MIPGKVWSILMMWGRTISDNMLRNTALLKLISGSGLYAGDKIDLKPYIIEGQIVSFEIAHQNIVIGKTSKLFTKKLLKSFNKGYQIEQSHVEFIAKWFSKDTDELLDIFLCRVILIYGTNNDNR